MGWVGVAVGSGLLERGLWCSRERARESQPGWIVKQFSQVEYAWAQGSGSRLSVRSREEGMRVNGSVRRREASHLSKRTTARSWKLFFRTCSTTRYMFICQHTRRRYRQPPTHPEASIRTTFPQMSVMVYEAFGRGITVTMEWESEEGSWAELESGLAVRTHMVGHGMEEVLAVLVPGQEVGRGVLHTVRPLGWQRGLGSERVHLERGWWGWGSG